MAGSSRTSRTRRGFCAPLERRRRMACATVGRLGIPGCRRQHSLDVAVVVGAAADVAGHRRADLVRRWMSIASEQPFGAHELSGRAKSTLRSVVLYERPLKRVQLVAMSEALDGADLSPIGPHRQIAARIDGLTVQQHRAGSAFAAITADLGAGQAEMVAQQFGKRPTIFHLK